MREYMTLWVILALTGFGCEVMHTAQDGDDGGHEPLSPFAPVQRNLLYAREGSMITTIEQVICPTSAQNLRNSEGSMISLRDGSLLLAYTRFRSGSGSDFAPADIVTCRSGDGGKTWSPLRIVAAGDDERGNVLSASLLRLGRGALALFYDRLTFDKGASYTTGNMDDISSPNHWLTLCVSDDEGETWSQPCELNPPGEHSLVLLNDSAVRLSSGRLILPTYRGHSPHAHAPEFVQPILSDDDGRTWFPSPLPARPARRRPERIISGRACRRKFTDDIAHRCGLSLLV